MLSHATYQTGHGKGFGLHEALDQIGATLGPLIITGALLADSSLRHAFAWLLIPAVVALSILLVTRIKYPRPQTLEATAKETIRGVHFPREYWLYLSAAALVAAGFVDYPLLALHFQRADIMNNSQIAIYYAIAMGTDAIAALCFGWLFDRVGLKALVVSTVVSMFFPVFAFLGGGWAALIGVVLWGTGMGAQESIMRSAVAKLSSKGKRATAYGLFNMIYGVA